jgi:O-antigen/teichoic acid export membrane protein
VSGTTGIRTGSNTAILVASNVTIRAIGFFVAIWIARTLPQADFGRYTLSLAMAGMFSILTDLGMSANATRTIAADRSLLPIVVADGLLVRAALAAVALLAYALVIKLLGYPPQLQFYLLLAFGALALDSASYYCYACFRALELMKWEGLVMVSQRLLSFGLIAAILQYNRGVTGLLLANLLSAAVAFGIIMLLLVNAARGPAMRPDMERAWKLLKGSLPLAVLGLVVMAYWRIDVIILQKMQGDQALAVYRAGYNVLEAVLLFNTVLATVWYPVLARTAAEGRERFFATQKTFARLLLLSGLPITVGGMVLAQPLLSLLYNGKYAASAPSFLVLMLEVTLAGFSALCSFSLMALRQDRFLVLFAIGSLIVNVGLNLFLIPSYGPVGAAWATCLSELVPIAGGLLVLRRAIGLFIPDWSFLSIAFAATVMGAILHLTLGMVSLPVSLALAVPFYFVIVFITRGLSIDDLSGLRVIRQRFKL